MVTLRWFVIDYRFRIEETWKRVSVVSVKSQDGEAKELNDCIEGNCERVY